MSPLKLALAVGMVLAVTTLPALILARLGRNRSQDGLSLELEALEKKQQILRDLQSSHGEPGRKEIHPPAA